MTRIKKAIKEFCFVTDYVANGSFASLKENVIYKNSPDYAVLVRVTDFTKNWNNNYVWVDEASFRFLGKSTLNPDDLIMANVGETGKCFIVPDLGQPMTLGPNAILIRPDLTESTSRYLFYYFTSEIGRQSIEKISSATTQSKFNKTSFRELEIPLPPLHIQQQIVDTLDKANDLRKKDKELIRKYDELAKSIFYDMFGDPVTNEKNWKITPLGELGIWKSGGTPSRANSSFFEGSIPWLSSGELNDMYVSKSKEHITPEAVRDSAAKIITPGSLLLGMYDTAALKSSITKHELSCNQAIAFAKLDDSLCSTQFVYFYIQMAKEHLKRGQRGVRQKNLNLSMVKELPVIAPPLEMQRAFTSILNDLYKQKKIAERNAQQSDVLFNSMLWTNYN
ncbi:restriction endonuclease subunit S [Rufibacter aurantiacus]|uniref:restriction endonuclease subunit S n=1 Tax=Rufibacter aurantiacus TaxID=2817374 RepID=UPI001B310870|nr:restriction endonuclease subunit S [Rufibacter aurantiacus]